MNPPPTVSPAWMDDDTAASGLLDGTSLAVADAPAFPSVAAFRVGNCDFRTPVCLANTATALPSSPSALSLRSVAALTAPPPDPLEPDAPPAPPFWPDPLPPACGMLSQY